MNLSLFEIGVFAILFIAIGFFINYIANKFTKKT